MNEITKVFDGALYTLGACMVASAFISGYGLECSIGGVFLVCVTRAWGRYGAG